MQIFTNSLFLSESSHEFVEISLELQKRPTFSLQLLSHKESGDLILFLEYGDSEDPRPVSSLITSYLDYPEDEGTSSAPGKKVLWWDLTPAQFDEFRSLVKGVITESSHELLELKGRVAPLASSAKDEALKKIDRDLKKEGILLTIDPDDGLVEIGAGSMVVDNAEKEFDEILELFDAALDSHRSSTLDDGYYTFHWQVSEEVASYLIQSFGDANVYL